MADDESSQLEESQWHWGTALISSGSTVAMMLGCVFLGYGCRYGFKFLANFLHKRAELREAERPITMEMRLHRLDSDYATPRCLNLGKLATDHRPTPGDAARILQQAPTRQDLEGEESLDLSNSSFKQVHDLDKADEFTLAGEPARPNAEILKEARLKKWKVEGDALGELFDVMQAQADVVQAERAARKRRGRLSTIQEEDPDAIQVADDREAAQNLYDTVPQAKPILFPKTRKPKFFPKRRASDKK